MPCFKPIEAYMIKGQKTENGKKKIVFNLKDVKDYPYETISLQCGGCIGCRVGRSREWAIRCVHESSFFDNNMFITLTFDDTNINKNKTLVKKDFQNFIKRFRAKYTGIQQQGTKKVWIKKKGLTEVPCYPIRYYHCGEYGEGCKVCGMHEKECSCDMYTKGIGRPHHHACIFNFDFALASPSNPKGKKLYTIQQGHRLYTCEKLDELWSVDGKKLGFALIGDVTYESAAYVARYITKKITGKKEKYHYSRLDKETGELIKVLPEYTSMSRRPGIGKGWLEKNYKNIYNKDFLTHKGKIFSNPKYYDKLYEAIEPEEMEVIKSERKEKAIKMDEGAWRRASKEKCFKARIDKLLRRL